MSEQIKQFAIRNSQFENRLSRTDAPQMRVFVGLQEIENQQSPARSACSLTAEQHSAYLRGAGHKSSLDVQYMPDKGGVHEIENRQSEIENSLPWWVIHTRPRCEKKMDQWLAEHGMGHYLPVRTRLRIYPGKRVAFDHPLFAGYAFGAFSLQQRKAVYGSGYAAGVIEVVDQEGFLGELDAVRRALAADVPVTECPYLAVGRRVRIISGKLRGLEGIVQRRARRTKLILSVEMLQRSLALEIEPELLEPVG